MLIRSIVTSFFLILLLTLSAATHADEYAWELKKEKDGIRVFTRKVEGSKYKAVRAVTRITTSLNAIVALVRDTEACPELAGLCKESHIERKISETELYVYSYNDMPWPVKDRDVVAQVLWSQDPDDLRVTMKASAVADIVSLNENAVRLKVADVSWYFIPRDDRDLDVITEAYIDPEGPVPAFIVNLLLVNYPFETLKNVRSVVQTGRYDDADFDFIIEPSGVPATRQ